MIRNIVFDMGGVLMDYQPLLPCRRHAANEEEAQAIHQAIFLAPEWETALDGGFCSEEDMLAVAQSRLDTPTQKETAARIYADYHTDALFPMPGMKAVVQRLYDRGFQIYLLSNAGSRIHQYLHRIPGIDLFTDVLISYQEKLLKPEPPIYHRFLDKCSLEAAECLFIDNLQRNIDGAVVVGMQGYCFADGDVARLMAFLEALPRP